jgi:hypothetical protein
VEAPVAVSSYALISQRKGETKKRLLRKRKGMKDGRKYEGRRKGRSE